MSVNAEKAYPELNVQGRRKDGNTDNERILTSITGLSNKSDRTLLNIKDRVESILKWSDAFPDNILKFENLVGEKRGGCAETQIHELKKLLNILEIEHEDQLISNIVNNLFGIGGAFRSGQIGSWKNYSIRRI